MLLGFAPAGCPAGPCTSHAPLLAARCLPMASPLVRPPTKHVANLSLTLSRAHNLQLVVIVFHADSSTLPRVIVLAQLACDTLLLPARLSFDPRCAFLYDCRQWSHKYRTSSWCLSTSVLSIKQFFERGLSILDARCLHAVCSCKRLAGPCTCCAR